MHIMGPQLTRRYVISCGYLQSAMQRQLLREALEYEKEQVLARAVPFDSGCSPLSYSGNPGVNGGLMSGVDNPSIAAVYP